MSEFGDRGVIDKTNIPELVRVIPDQIPYTESGKVVTEIDSYVDYLNETNHSTIKINPGLDFSYHLSGSTTGSMRIDQSRKINVESLTDLPYPEPVKGAGSWKSIHTGVDLNYLIKEFPNDRWKFYLSLDTITAENQAKAMTFLREFVKRCQLEKISLLIKTEIHDYDNPDIYTWQPMKMTKILSELYQDPRFSDIWFKTDHFMQKPLEGISADHIGMVQEPMKGLNWDSHSGRMENLGRHLDEYSSLYGEEITLTRYMEAAKSAGVEPSQPWRISRLLPQASK